MCTLSTAIFENSIARIGTFRCPVNHPQFSDTGPIRSGHLVVFPRSPVRIILPRRGPIVADTNTIMFYNRRQPYRRESLSRDGDRCEWFAFNPTLLATTLAEQHPEPVDLNQPFQLTHAPSHAQMYLQQRLIVAHLLQATTDQQKRDALWLDEALLALLEWIIGVYRTHHRSPFRRLPSQRGSRTKQQHQEIVHTVQEHLATRFTNTVTLDELASVVHLSSYELCRIFRRHTTVTIHHYLTQLRLRSALDRLAEEPVGLTTVALDLGYSSHSHFTSAFRRTFGVPPSVVYKNLRCESNHLLQKLASVVVWSNVA